MTITAARFRHFAVVGVLWVSTTASATAVSSIVVPAATTVDGSLSTAVSRWAAAIASAIVPTPIFVVVASSSTILASCIHC